MAMLNVKRISFKYTREHFHILCALVYVNMIIDLFPFLHFSALGRNINKSGSQPVVRA